MEPARIAELLQPFLVACHSDRSRSESDGAVEEPAVLSPAQLQSISIYIDILERWNARMSLTSIRDPEEIVTRHFGESLFAARTLFPAHQSTANEPISLADVGSGAGFPGIPIKLWSPEISLTLIESNQRKATFLREVTRALTLTNVDIQASRAETIPAASFDVITLRAVERFENILPVAARLARPGGRLALLIGQAQHPQAKATLPSVHWHPPQPIPNSQSRILLEGALA